MKRAVLFAVKPEPTVCTPSAIIDMFGAVILVYFENIIVNLSVLNVSNILLPEAPYQSVELLGTSPFADLITIIRNVTSEYLSFSSSIILNETPIRLSWSPIRSPIVSSWSAVPLRVDLNPSKTKSIKS